MSLGDGNTNLWGLDIIATSVDTNLGYAIVPATIELLEEARTTIGPPTAFMATDGLAEMGGKERAFAQWNVEW